MNEMEILYSHYWSNCVTLGRKPLPEEEWIKAFNEQRARDQEVVTAFKIKCKIINDKINEECEAYDAYLDECERLGLLPGEKRDE